MPSRKIRVFFRWLAVRWWERFAWQHRVFLLIQLAIAGVAMWFWYHLPLPGWAVAILAAVAAAMSVHGDMRPWQKSLWMVLIGVLLVVELRAISKDRSDADGRATKAQQTENSSFKDIRDAQDADFHTTVDGLKTAIQNSSDQFKATMKANQKVLDNAVDADRASRKNLANITGGKSFAVVFLPVQVYPTVKHPLIIENHGDNILTGVTVTIYSSGVWLRGTEDALIDSVNKRVTVGTLHPHERLVLSTQILAGAVPPNAPERTLFVYIAAQNFTTVEYLTIRNGKEGGFAYKYSAFKQLTAEESKSLHGRREPALERASWSDEKPQKITHGY